MIVFRLFISRLGIGFLLNVFVVTITGAMKEVQNRSARYVLKIQILNAEVILEKVSIQVILLESEVTFLYWDIIKHFVTFIYLLHYIILYYTILCH